MRRGYRRASVQRGQHDAGQGPGEHQAGNEHGFGDLDEARVQVCAALDVSDGDAYSDAGEHGAGQADTGQDAPVSCCELHCSST